MFLQVIAQIQSAAETGWKKIKPFLPNFEQNATILFLRAKVTTTIVFSLIITQLSLLVFRRLDHKILRIFLDICKKRLYVSLSHCTDAVKTSGRTQNCFCKIFNKMFSINQNAICSLLQSQFYLSHYLIWSFKDLLMFGIICVCLCCLSMFLNFIDFLFLKLYWYSSATCFICVFSFLFNSVVIILYTVLSNALISMIFIFFLSCF